MELNVTVRYKLPDTATEARCPKHNEPWLPGVAPDGDRRCTFYIPELGVSENYGCPRSTISL